MVGTIYIMIFPNAGLLSLAIIGSYLVPPRRDLVTHEHHLARRNLSTFLDEIPTQVRSVISIIIPSN